MQNLNDYSYLSDTKTNRPMIGVIDLNSNIILVDVSAVKIFYHLEIHELPVS
jgi:hypothetical protein